MMDMEDTFNKLNFPKIMGILNITPDSFSDGGNFFSTEKAFERAQILINDGAEILDIGGESSRPNAVPVRIDEEIRRVIPVIEKIKDKFPNTKISIDTVKYEVAKQAIASGADIINDISGLVMDVRLAELAAINRKQLIIMHMKGKPQDMQNNPEYNDVVFEVRSFLIEQSRLAVSMGVPTVFIDVGIGFGKTVEHNLELLRNLDKFQGIASGMLLGISRKAFIGKILNISNPSERDTATSMMHSLLLNSPIDIIRVHNVKLISDLKNLVLSLRL